jgi:hypothetical protein
MVISDKYGYVFVELPRTGSTAISRELREHYDGRNVLHKHATYDEFLGSVAAGRKDYFALGGLRNPLDDAVSLYFKLLTDHKRAYSDLKHLNWFTRLAYAFRRRQFRFAQDGKAEFSRFFLKFYRWPYDNWSCLSHSRFDCLLRFENLEADFARAVAGFGATAVRPLPVTNKTAARQMHYSSYYDDAAIARAKWVFGVYMQKWGYEFPKEWGADSTRPSAWNLLVFRFLNVFRRFYWRHLRPAIYARTVRERRERRKAQQTGT